MENASKALVMAGGILIALLIIGALLLMLNQIGDYEKAQTSDVKEMQLAQFNSDFERYVDDKGITGVDIISLINKVIDYNKKANKGGVTNSVNYNIKMSIEVSGLRNFNEKYVYELFGNDSYICTENNELKKIFDRSSVERIYSEFKSSTFVISQNPVYENGQIKDLYFKFSK